MDGPAVDPDLDQRRAADPAASVWVGASAGTGKTKVLTDRVLRLLLAGNEPHRILCLTFTKAAANEMRRRIANLLAEWAIAADEKLEADLAKLLGRAPGADECAVARRLLAQVLDSPGGVGMETIHGFCQSLLARFPLEAGLSPHFQVMDERQAAVLLREARQRVTAVDADRDGSLAGALRVLAEQTREDGFAALLGSVIESTGRFRRMLAAHGSAENAIAAVFRCLGLAPDTTAESVITAAADDGAFERAALIQAADTLLRGSNSDVKRGNAIAAWLAADPAGRQAGLADYRRAFLTGDTPPTILQRLITVGLARAHPNAADVLRTEAERMLAVDGQLRAAISAEATAALVTLATAVIERYDALKRRAGRLDYDDLIQRAAALLEEDGGASWVMFKLDEGIDHVLVDESQDTNPLQWRIIRALTGEFFAGAGARQATRTIFVVGDVKQSIYSFQGADPAASVNEAAYYQAAVGGAGGDWRSVDLTVSFRSTPAVLAAVDAVFAGDAAQGVAPDAVPIHHAASRQQDGGRVEVWPLVVPRTDDPPEAWRPPVERQPADVPVKRLATLVALRIAKVIAEGELLPSRNRRAQAGDILVLVRSRDKFYEELVRALKQAGVPVAGADRLKLTGHIAIMDLIAAGRFALLPDDDLTLACLLKSPLIGLDEDQLMALAIGRDGSLWRAIVARAAAAAVGDPVRVAHERLAALLAAADRLPPFDFYARLLGAGGGLKRFIGRLGRECEDPISEFLALAADAERTEPPSLGTFLQELETANIEIKRDFDLGRPDAVRIMTVHGAKGLQAPLVIIADTKSKDAAQSNVLWIDATAGPVMVWTPRAALRSPVVVDALQRLNADAAAERRRLLYVAMTRAEDILIVCGTEPKAGGGAERWHGLVSEGLRARGDAIGLQEIDDPFLAGHMVPGASLEPPLIDAARVLRVERRLAREIQSPADVAPCSAEALNADDTAPLPRENVPTPLVPSRAVASPVKAAAGSEQAAAAARQRGILLHGLLQHLPAVEPERRPAVADHWLRQRDGALPESERRVIAAEVVAVLSAPHLAFLFDGSGGAQALAEVPVFGDVDGYRISGRIDRLLVDRDHITVVDFKTDRTVPSAGGAVPAPYRRQLAAYARAMAAIFPERPVRAGILWTATASWTPLDEGAVSAECLDP